MVQFTASQPIKCGDVVPASVNATDSDGDHDAGYDNNNDDDDDDNDGHWR